MLQGEEAMANAEAEEKAKKQGKCRKCNSQKKVPGRNPEFKK